MLLFAELVSLAQAAGHFADQLARDAGTHGFGSR